MTIGVIERRSASDIVLYRTAEVEAKAPVSKPM